MAIFFHGRKATYRAVVLAEKERGGSEMPAFGGLLVEEVLSFSHFLFPPPPNVVPRSNRWAKSFTANLLRLLSSHLYGLHTHAQGRMHVRVLRHEVREGAEVPERKKLGTISFPLPCHLALGQCAVLLKMLHIPGVHALMYNNLTQCTEEQRRWKCVSRSGV